MRHAFLIFCATFTFLVFPGVALAVNANLHCSPLNGTYNINDTFSVDFILDTKDISSLGAEIYTTYDPSLVDIVGTQSAEILTTTHWSSSLTNTIDTSLGKIHLDFGNTQATYSGTTSVGRVTFKAKSVGSMPFSFTFFQPNDDTTPGVSKVWGLNGSTLSNVLNDVTNCTYTISASAPSATPTPRIGDASATATPSPTMAPTATPTITELPKSGGDSLTQKILLGGFFLMVLGATYPLIFKAKHH